jgi:hypothetical protein
VLLVDVCRKPIKAGRKPLAKIKTARFIGEVAALDEASMELHNADL